MSFVLNEEQRLLQDQVRALLQQVAPFDRLRAVIDEKLPSCPETWAQLSALGVLGAGIPEEYGGVGLSPIEVGVVAQEVGRAVAPVPFISSICQAAEAILIAGTVAQKEAWLPRLAAGEITATVAWCEGLSTPAFEAGETRIEGGKIYGAKWPVADGTTATLCIMTAAQEGRTVLALIDLTGIGVTRRRLRSIDELRPYAELRFDGAPAEILGDATDAEEGFQAVLDRAAVYEAFEQVGGAESALTMVRDYVVQRYIFGRPLGSFQAVKHALANSYARIELAACNALYAAQALRDKAPDARAAAATARISATEAYEQIARENLQFHGGIGFTWEGNCHFHYRRARALALDLGSVEFWSDRLVKELGKPEGHKGPRDAPGRRSKVEAPEDEAFRQQARAWIAASRGDLRLSHLDWESEESGAASRAWTARKSAAGYSAIALPKELGGAGGTRKQQAIFAEEERAAGIGIGVGGAAWIMAHAAINGHGAEEQRLQWLSRTHSGEILWCQLFSEPGAGSDLAAVRTRAVRQGDKWIVNGQKVWTSAGRMADFGILLARTDPDLPKHQGLSFFLIDMRQPGVTTRPIRQINGQSDFTETFLVDAEVPDAYRLGEVGQGWAVAMTVLAAERTTTQGIGEGGERKASSTSARSLIELAASRRRAGGTALDSAVVRRRIAQFHAEAQGIKNFTLRLQRQVAAGGPPPVNVPVIKLTATNRIQQIQAFLMDLDEMGGIVEAPDAPDDADRFYEYLTSASSRIAGGADEVLRNQLAERALGLPADMRADKDVPFSKLP
ncbi:MAG: acyl-CoA dehydrogenase, partial [Caulobacterales bacterium]